MPGSSNLEDRAFGPPEEAVHRSSTWPECTAAYMLPLTVAVALVGASTYALCKGIEYQELFRNNVRYRNGLLAANGLAIAVALVVVAVSVHSEARYACRVD